MVDTTARIRVYSDIKLGDILIDVQDENDKYIALVSLVDAIQASFAGLDTTDNDDEILYERDRNAWHYIARMLRIQADLIDATLDAFPKRSVR